MRGVLVAFSGSGASTSVSQAWFAPFNPAISKIVKRRQKGAIQITYDLGELMTMKITLHTFLSLDGVMQGPGRTDEDTTGGFDLGGWMVPYADQDMTEIVDSWFERAEAILLGRTTYVMMRDYWTKVTDPDNLVATQLNNLPKYIASTTLTESTWHNSTVLGRETLAQIRTLASEGDGELQIHGSCGLAGLLHEAEMIDEYRLLMFPVVLGKGKKLFKDGTPSSGFAVVDNRTTSKGGTYVALQPRVFVPGSFEVVDGQHT